MSDVFLSYSNIISSLGFDSETVVENISKKVSGLQLVQDIDIFPQPFYTSLIDKKKLKEVFENLHPDSLKYTHLEQMMLVSLQEVIKQSNIELNDRVGLIISTTKGNIDVLENESTFSKSRSYLSSNACVSGILAVAIAKRYIKQGVYDQVFIVSGDIVTPFILSGFNSFQALSDEPCKPYCKKRSGINIGEVAASILVTSKKEDLSTKAVKILGEGSCNDANHISGPSRTGEGLYRSVKSAFREAKINSKEIDFISAHGTATHFNDEMEAIAFNRLGLSEVPLHSLKSYFGHTLGASGLLETIIGIHSLHNNTLYPSLGFEELGVSKPLNIITETEYREIHTFLKTASGFGGCNTAVIFQKNKK
jgi:3-oxoacyl-[acyl-carrier-protein] synthase-1